MNRNYTLDYLRATAALMVCICHFRHCLPEPFESIATEGHIGVQIFFVISGYVIPFTMAKGGYQLRSMGNFWLKRIARLHPTYLAALLITFAVSASASFVHGAGLSFSHWDVLKSAFYLWIPAENPVIWTLIIELKYYLLIGLLFPLFFSQRHVLRRGGFLITLALAAFFVFKDRQFIPYFLLGFVAAYNKLELASKRETALLALLALCATYSSSSIIEIAAGAATCLTIVFITTPKWAPGFVLGEITYSLYLLHFPIGVKMINLLLPGAPEMLRPFLLVLALLLSCGAATVLFYVVERPSITLSKRIRYSKTASSPNPLSLGEKEALAEQAAR